LHQDKYKKGCKFISKYKLQNEKHNNVTKETIPEEFPEGPYGSSFNKDEKIVSKSEKEDSPSMSPYDYPEGGLQRQVPGAYPTKEK